MLTISFRPINEQERELLQTPVPSVGCISNVAAYGGLLILVPAVLGGLIGTILKLFGCSENVGYGIGLGVASTVGITWAALFFAENARRRRRWRQERQRNLEDGRVQVLAIQTILRVWSVDLMEPDFGPAYLLEYEPNKFLYVAYQGFADYWEEDNPDDFPGDALTVERSPADRVVLNAAVSGPRKKTEPQTLEDAAELAEEYCIRIPDEIALPASWQTLIAPA